MRERSPVNWWAMAVLAVMLFLFAVRAIEAAIYVTTGRTVTTGLPGL